MKRTEVINLGQVRDLLGAWTNVLHAIRGARIKGFQLSIIREDDTEAVYTGGVYREDPRKAVSALLKMSAARMLADDKHPSALKKLG